MEYKDQYLEKTSSEAIESYASPVQSIKKQTGSSTLKECIANIEKIVKEYIIS